MRVGMIGAGMFGDSSIARFHDAGAEVVSVCDVVPDRARASAEKYGIAHFSDKVSELLARDDIDLVHVAVPPNHLYEVVSATIAAGKNVLSEKPLTTSAQDARKLFEEATAAGVVHAVDHEMRYDPLHCHVRNLVREGFIGRPRVFSVRDFQRYARDQRYPTYYATWTAFREAGGGVGQQHLSHTLDLAQSIVGWLKPETAVGHSVTYMHQRPVLDPSVTPVALFGLGDQAPTTGLADVNGDDVATVSGLTSTGVVLHVVSGWTVHHPTGLTWELYGDEGTLTLNSAGELYGARHDQEVQRIVAPPELALPHGPSLLEQSGLGVLEGQCVGFMFEALAQNLARTTSGASTEHVYCTFDEALVTRTVLDSLAQSVITGE
ncbi:Gfo/Idh/MocA family protein [Cryptosporangium aurantiacum]|uniref:Predicted dehydrogenase n=1 Tax=Cryptosporangium aurantiacum TaxID=134849 RepID=A0A1M7R4B9_9ACTN|nr:Gfo/Idh/MocA family oxidoreductase [Cryptosporangium aurantiacum]SHN40033.1 Predicted dehydrogenase [Cryptosporangium aurantiacum]